MTWKNWYQSCGEKTEKNEAIITPTSHIQFLYCLFCKIADNSQTMLWQNWRVQYGSFYLHLIKCSYNAVWYFVPEKFPGEACTCASYSCIKLKTTTFLKTSPAPYTRVWLVCECILYFDSDVVWSFWSVVYMVFVVCNIWKNIEDIWGGNSKGKSSI